MEHGVQRFLRTHSLRSRMHIGAGTFLFVATVAFLVLLLLGAYCTPLAGHDLPGAEPAQRPHADAILRSLRSDVTFPCCEALRKRMHL